MNRHYVPFDQSWRMPIPVRVSRAVRVGGRLFTCGQVDLDSEGRAQNPGDLLAQSARTLDHLYGVLAEGGFGPDDLAQLHVFYRNDGSHDETAYRAALSDLLRGGPAPVMLLTPLPTLFYSGVEVEIDAVALRGPRHQAGAPPKALRCGETIVAAAGPARDGAGRIAHPDDPAAQAAEVMEQLAASLTAFGADLDDLCKLTLYLASDDGTVMGLVARCFAAPGPVLTCVPLPRLGTAGEVLQAEVVALRGVQGERPPRRHLERHPSWSPRQAGPFVPGLRCGDLIFAGAQLALDGAGRVLAPGHLAAQTRSAMGHLRKTLQALGADLADLVKVNTYYVGGAEPEALHENLSIRSSYYGDPGPASTGMPLPRLVPEGAMISIDAIAALP